MNLLKNMTVLSEEEMTMIHMNVMEVLKNVGIMVEEEESLKLLEENGATVDYDKENPQASYQVHLRIPRNVIRTDEDDILLEANNP